MLELFLINFLIGVSLIAIYSMITPAEVGVFDAYGTNQIAIDQYEFYLLGRIERLVIISFFIFNATLINSYIISESLQGKINIYIARIKILIISIITFSFMLFTFLLNSTIAFMMFEYDLGLLISRLPLTLLKLSGTVFASYICMLTGHMLKSKICTILMAVLLIGSMGDVMRAADITGITFYGEPVGVQFLLSVIGFICSEVFIRKAT